MARRSKRQNPEILRQQLISLLEGFENRLKDDDLRDQVKCLIPAHGTLRDLGSSLILNESANSGAERIIAYLLKYPKMLVQGDELMVVAGISEYARRIRELRVQKGWKILSGNTLRDLFEEERQEIEHLVNDVLELKPDTYILLSRVQDRDAAHRWNLANEIRKSDLSVQNKILKYLRANVGKEVTGEELTYLAKNRSEWARRVRELRTELGWPVATKSSGRSDLSVGIYILERDKQAEVHDRKIPDPIRIKVLDRDGYSCRQCNWNHENRKEADRVRNLLELHHIEHHAAGGSNTLENLITLCNVCHDDVHRGNIPSDELLLLLT